MKGKSKAFLILMLLVFSAFISSIVESTAASPALPDYIPIDLAEAPSYEIVVEGTITPRSHHSYWQVDDYAYWLMADFYSGYYYLTAYQLKAIGQNVEIWVQVDLGWPKRDARTYPEILPKQIEYLLNVFDNKIYQMGTNYFGVPDFHYGSYAYLPGLLGLSSDYYYEEGGRNVILVSNIRDENYYDPEYPYYIVGFYSPSYELYFDRNVITIDCYQWERRVGEPGYEWVTGVPVTHPYVYESTIAHEYQHLIHDDYNPEDEDFMNEGCSMYAELLCGYGIDPTYLNSFFYTPDNSLTVWGDQGDINILADYGAAALWVVYLSDHYGGAELISYFVQSGIPGIEGVNNALAYFRYKKKFEDVYRDWKLANLIRADFPGGGKYNYKSLNLNAPEIIPVRIYEFEKLPVPWKEGTDFGNTITILGYDTGVSKIGPFGTDYIAFQNWKTQGYISFNGDDDAFYGWQLTEQGFWWSNGENLMDALLVDEAYVDPANPTLTLVTKYEIEPLWDFGFVQVSTDSGKTWVSLENKYTTYEHDPEAHPAIIANLPGLTGTNKKWPRWNEMTFDLSTYAGKTVLIGFRYMTDWAVFYDGWYINSANVSKNQLELKPVYPEADFQVTVIYAYKVDGRIQYMFADMQLNDQYETGVETVHVKSPACIILAISPTMHEGWVDYTFNATPLK